MKVTRDVLKRWFSDGKTPTGEQFADWQDSYYHKDDPIKPENIDGLKKELEDLKENKEDKTDATNKYNDLNGRKEDKAEADKKFGDLNAAVTNLQNSKEDQADATNKYNDLDGRKEDKAEADKKFGDLNAAVTNLQNTKEDQADATNKYNDLNGRKEDKADMVNYLRIDPNGLQDNDIAIREGGQWVRKQASEISTINPLTVQQNGQTIGTFDGRTAATVNVDTLRGNTSAGINFVAKDNSEINIDQFIDYYMNVTSGSNIVKGAFSWNDNYVLKTPYNDGVNQGRVSLANISALITGYSRQDQGAQTLIMCGANKSLVSDLTNELLMYDARADSYSSTWTRMLTDHNFKDLAPKLAQGGTWAIDVDAKIIKVNNISSVLSIFFEMSCEITLDDTMNSLNFISTGGNFNFLKKHGGHGDIYCNHVYANQAVQSTNNLALRYDPVNYIKQSENVEIYWNNEIGLPEFDIESVKHNLPDLITDNKDEEGNVTSHSLNVQAILMAKLAAMEDVIKQQEERIKSLEQRLGEN